MTFHDFAYEINGASFQPAKSMPGIPHEYSVRKNWKDPKLFEEVVTFIRENGYEERFYSRVYIYYNYQGHKYWTMGSPLAQTIILNRAKLPEGITL